MAQYYWRTRVGFGPERAVVNLVVRRGGEILGAQGFETSEFAVSRTAETGSWLGQRFQGKGIGTAMRRAVCVLLFDHLGAVEVTSSAFTDNPASLAVSRKIGNADNGTRRVRRRPGEAAVLHYLVLTPDRFDRAGVEVEVEGAEALLAALGG